MMKKLLIMVIALIGFTSMAQERQRTNKVEFTPEQIAALQTKRMTLALDLSSEQQAKIQEIELKQAKLRKAKMDERRAKKESDDTKKPTSDQLYALKEAKLNQQIARKAEMKSILSAEQYAQWDKMSQKRNKRGKTNRGKNEHKKGDKGKREHNER